MQGGDKNNHQLCHLLRVTPSYLHTLVNKGLFVKLLVVFWPGFSIMLHGVSYPEVFPKIGVPQNGWFIIREKPIENG